MTVAFVLFLVRGMGSNLMAQVGLELVYADQVGLELSIPLSSVSQVLGLWAYELPWPHFCFFVLQ